jgi:hypothetical protein
VLDCKYTPYLNYNVRNYIYSHTLFIRDACLCIFVFLYFHSNVNTPTTAYDAWLINLQHYIFLRFACPHGTPIVSKTLTNKCLLEENKKITTKESPLKDGNVPNEPRRPSDDVPKLASSLSCRESGTTMQRKSPCHKHDDDVSKIQQASDTEPKSSRRNSTGHERALDQQSDADVDVSETSDVYHLPMTSKYRVTS